MINPSDINILIAEDEPDLRDLLAAKFRVFGFNVETAHSGDSAWEKVQSISDLQIVVTDVRMPGGSGYDLLKNCKNRNAILPKVFVISAFSDFPRHQLYDMGAEGFMTKPFDTKVLLDVIRKSLLSAEDRWRAPNSTTKKGDVSADLPKLDDAIASQVFGAGRGGFFVKGTAAKELYDQLVSFNYDFDGQKFEGTGIIRWMDPNPNESSAELPNHYGVEIVQLGKESADLFTGLLADPLPQPYIPCPDSLKGE